MEGRKKSKFSTFDPLTSFELNDLLKNDDLKPVTSAEMNFLKLIFVAIGGKVE